MITYLVTTSQLFDVTKKSNPTDTIGLVPAFLKASTSKRKPYLYRVTYDQVRKLVSRARKDADGVLDLVIGKPSPSIRLIKEAGWWVIVNDKTYKYDPEGNLYLSVNEEIKEVTSSTPNGVTTVSEVSKSDYYPLSEDEMKENTVAVKNQKKKYTDLESYLLDVALKIKDLVTSFDGDHLEAGFGKIKFDKGSIQISVKFEK